MSVRCWPIACSLVLLRGLGEELVLLDRNLKLFNELIPALAEAGLEAKVLVIYCFAVMNNE